MGRGDSPQTVAGPGACPAGAERRRDERPRRKNRPRAGRGAADFSAAADFFAGAPRGPGARRAPDRLRGVLGARIILTPADFILALV